MRSRAVAATVISLSLAGLALWSMSSAAATTARPWAQATAGTHVGFTVSSTSTPTPTPTGGGGGGGGGTTPPVCVPSDKAPAITPSPADTSVPLQANPKRVAQGSDVLVTANGFRVGEKVLIVLYAGHQKLGISTVRTNGQVYADLTIPTRTALGEHTIQVTGFRDCRIAAGNITVVSRPGSGTSIFPWIVWLIAGGTLTIAGIGILIAYLLGWLPKAAVIATTKVIS